MITQKIDELIDLVIPVYTHSKPNPVNGKVDCPMIRGFKKTRRESMREKLNELIKRYDESTTNKSE